MSGTQLPGVTLDKSVARSLALGLAGVRIGLGLAAYVRPALVASPWIGSKQAKKKGAQLLGRALGSRDVALGLGALLAARHDGPIRGWIEAGLLADSGDAVATLVAWKNLPTRSRWGILAVTVGAVALAAATAPFVDD
jgi:hypothetical protein